MACQCSCKSEITEDHKKILTAMAGLGTPCGCKEISAATGIDGKIVGSHLKTLKTKGYVGSPARCRYEITSEGKAAI
ncbi:MAG: ArsR family transcriptional regulator [Desulfurivibrio sp.]|nr:MAG: ArsR family transcriptional regulator [Desulfurivibrio sp.]